VPLDAGEADSSPVHGITEIVGRRAAWSGRRRFGKGGEPEGGFEADGQNGDARVGDSEGSGMREDLSGVEKDAS
jgi:hypothetical protein